MQKAKCPKCKRTEAFRVSDAALVLREDKLVEIAGWWCDYCCVQWIKDKPGRKARHEARVARAKKYKAKKDDSV